MSTFSRIEVKNSLLFTCAITATLVVGGIFVTSTLVPTNASSTTISVREGSDFNGGDRQEYVWDEGSGHINKKLSIQEDSEVFPLTASNIGTVAGVPGLFVQDFDRSLISDAYLDRTTVTVAISGQDNRDAAGVVTLRQFIDNTIVPATVADSNNAVANPGDQGRYTITITPPRSAEGFDVEDMTEFELPFSLGFVFSATDDAGKTDLGRSVTAVGERVGDLFLIPNGDAEAASRGELPLD